MTIKDGALQNASLLDENGVLPQCIKSIFPSKELVLGIDGMYHSLHKEDVRRRRRCIQAIRHNFLLVKFASKGDSSYKVGFVVKREHDVETPYGFYHHHYSNYDKYDMIVLTLSGKFYVTEPTCELDLRSSTKINLKRQCTKDEYAEITKSETIPYVNLAVFESALNEARYVLDNESGDSSFPVTAVFQFLAVYLKTYYDLHRDTISSEAEHYVGMQWKKKDEYTDFASRHLSYPEEILSVLREQRVALQLRILELVDECETRQLANILTNIGRMPHSIFGFVFEHIEEMQQDRIPELIYVLDNTLHVRDIIRPGMTEYLLAVFFYKHYDKLSVDYSLIL